MEEMRRNKYQPKKTNSIAINTGDWFPRLSSHFFVWESVRIDRSLRPQATIQTVCLSIYSSRP